MALNLKELFDNYNAKVAEKINELKRQIDSVASGGLSGGGISEDAENDLTLGTDDKIFYKKPTAEEWATAYENLADTNKFTDAYKATLDNLDLSVKADLDPETGQIYPSQIPDLNITDVIKATESSLQDFLAFTNNYTYETGDVIVIDDGFGNLEHYLYNGGDRGLETSYITVNPAQVKMFDTVTDMRSKDGDDSFLYYVKEDKAIFGWDPAIPDYVQVGGGSVTSHSSLTGLQGGTTGEHYHITAAELEKLQNLQSDKSFTFTQGTASDTWSIQHNLGKYPSVTVVDSAGSVVEGDVVHTDLNNLTVSFNGGFSGEAVLN